MSFLRFRKFWAIISSNIFYSLLFPLFGIFKMYILLHLGVSHGSLRLFTFTYSFFFLPLMCNNFSCFTFWYTDIPFVCSDLLLTPSSDFFFFSNLFILFVCFWLHWVLIAARASSSYSKRGLLFVAVHGLLSAVASLVVEHGL